MAKPRIFLFLLGFLFLVSTAAMAQYPIIDAEQLKSHLRGNQKTVLIDARPDEEYQEAHIPGALNIPAGSMKEEAAQLPKDKKTALIFYCRGAG